jgi:glutathione S-transferase
MKIWGNRNMGNPLRVAIFLAEKGIDVPFDPVALMEGAHRLPEFVAKNPAAQVPVLELDDGTCIAETIAICRYFERLHPEPPLMGVGALDEAQVEMWQRRVEFLLYGPTREVMRHTSAFAKPLEPIQLADWADLNRPRISRALTWLETQLKAQPFIAGPRFTVADITAIFAFQTLDRIQFAMPDDAQGIRRWRAEVFSRPSVVSVVGAPKAA